MTVSALLKHRDAQLPIWLAVAALGVIVARVLLVGTEPGPDEGTAAHLFQLLILLQLVAMAYFTIRWLPQEPRATVPVLGLQPLAGAAALFPVWYFHF